MIGGSNKGGMSSLVIFLLGILLASNVFLFWQQYQNQKMTEGLKNDAINIIQAYNNLVNTLTQQGVLKASAPAPVKQPAAVAPVPATPPATTNDNTNK